ncbi:MAG: hypothetical protein LBK63_12050 [Treponema sp.]|jgi:hypothetical protein|nr:hypothetical protein [Treponema sp.]
MIDSWKSLISALDQMRRLQRDPHTAKNPDWSFRLKRLEVDVDLCVEKKLKEWSGKEQPELETH